jgi:hypothetical protein
MDHVTEGRILNALIDVNFDACRFYGEIANKTTAQQEKSLRNLQRLHIDVVADLGCVAYKIGTIPADDPAWRGDSELLFCDLLVENTPGPLGMDVVSRVEDAEARCREKLESAFVSDDLSIDIKAHVLGAVNTLRQTQEHIYSLKRDVR